jgi:hypothetical protein
MKKFLAVTRWGKAKKCLSYEQALETLSEGGFIKHYEKGHQGYWSEVPDPPQLSKKELRKRLTYRLNGNTARRFKIEIQRDYLSLVRSQAINKKAIRLAETELYRMQHQKRPLYIPDEIRQF